MIVQDVLSGERNSYDGLEQPGVSGEDPGDRRDGLFQPLPLKRSGTREPPAGNRLLVNEIRVGLRRGIPCWLWWSPWAPHAIPGRFPASTAISVERPGEKELVSGLPSGGLCRKRRNASPEESYTAKLLARGPSRVGQKDR